LTAGQLFGKPAFWTRDEKVTSKGTQVCHVKHLEECTIVGTFDLLVPDYPSAHIGPLLIR
jgi:hypothetical protein